MGFLTTIDACHHCLPLPHFLTVIPLLAGSFRLIYIKKNTRAWPGTVHALPSKLEGMQDSVQARPSPWSFKKNKNPYLKGVFLGPPGPVKGPN